MSKHYSSSNIIDNNLHEMIIGIDSKEKGRLYPVEKLDAHVRNVPHMAISIFIFHEQKLLLQKRADTKYHSGGLWANTVCSHPRWNEDVRTCASRRLQEELGWAVPLREFGRIDYAARVGKLYENERVHCFHGRLIEAELPSAFNPAEVSATKWLTIPEILKQIAHEPDSFSAWFKIYMARHRSMIDSQIDLKKANDVHKVLEK